MNKKIDLDKISIVYECPECERPEKESITNAIEYGGPMCFKCGHEIEMEYDCAIIEE